MFAIVGRMDDNSENGFVCLMVCRRETSSVSIIDTAYFAGFGSHDTRASFLFIPGIAGPRTDFGGAVGVIRTTGVTRTRGNDSGTFTAHIGISAFAFGRAVVVIFHTAIPQSNVGIVAADVTVVGVSRLADRGTGRRIIFGAAVLPFVNPGRTDAVGILSAAAVPRYRTRIRTVGRVVKIHILADAAFVSAAAGSALSDFL